LDRKIRGTPKGKNRIGGGLKNSRGKSPEGKKLREEGDKEKRTKHNEGSRKAREENPPKGGMEGEN